MTNTPFQTLCRDYLVELREARSDPQATPELSLRPALDSFLKSAAGLSGRDIVFISEGKKLTEGRPDFVLTSGGLPVGYVEAEKYELDLDKLAGHTKTQNVRFIANLDNFLLTNHLEFRLFLGGDLVAEAALPAPPDKGAPVVPEAKAEKLEALLEQLMKAAPLPIKAPRDLALHLSRRAREMRDQVRDLFRDGKADDDLLQAFKAFQDVLLPDLRPFLSDEDRRKPKRPHSFDDLFAQTVAYGLFAARCGHPSGAFTRHSAAHYLSSNPFLKKLFGRFMSELPPTLDWIVDDMAALLNAAPMGDIQQYFFKRTGREDPMIDFYEPFLQAYDPALREVRGVYYTPVPVVSYIVRSLHLLLQTRLNRPDGLADKETLILDPATGTGSFLFAAVDEIQAQVCKQQGGGAWPAYVEKHLLGRLFGFELLMAPYAIAHLKLGLQLAGQGAKVPDGERFGVYLTNTLDDAVKQSDLLMGKFISDEANAAVQVKTSEPVLVVLGNPPYSGISTNPSYKSKEEIKRLKEAARQGAKTGQIQSAVSKQQQKLQELTYIGRLIEAYKWVDGKPLGERKDWLQNDYVKFIAFAQERLRKTGEGIIGYITDNSFLDGPTFRGMRQSLLETFTDIYIYNLHGNSNKKERTPDNDADQNVFEIQQGVSILLGVKEKDKKGPACLHYADLWGQQKAKYQTLLEADISTTKWTTLEPASPFYWFVPRSAEMEEEYQAGWRLPDMTLVSSTGIVTARDGLTIALDDETLEKRMETFLDKSLSDAEVQQSLDLTENYAWRVSEARKQLRSEPNWKSHIKNVLHHPFDTRRIIFHPSIVWRTRNNVTRHMLAGNNLGLITTRQTRDDWGALATTQICGHKSFAAYDINSLFPLFLYPETNSQKSMETERRPNLSPLFIKAISEKLALPAEGEHGLPQGVTPEDIFHYAYAVFHAPSYRALYAEFLKSDFPRLPLTSDQALFFDLAALGRQLVALHLLDEKAAPILQQAGHRFEGVGNDVVEKAQVKWHSATRRVSINTTQGFEDVSEEVWEFRVGGYQVAQKWLKDRNGRPLSFDDQIHYRRTLTALAETARLMTLIDARIPAWPLV